MEPRQTLIPPEDKRLMPPLQQKRIVAFINHFLISSCGFLNDFAQRCESKFITLERKMQKIEAALIILEEKLDSVPAADIKNSPSTASPQVPPTVERVAEVEPTTETDPDDVEAETPVVAAVEEPSGGVMACNDTRYRKFFKMVQFGVPPQAVKLKMHSEGIENTSILDTPNLLLPDGISYVETED